MKQVTGDQLSTSERRKALARFVHRFTGDHKPQWASKEWKDGKPYPLQFKNDQEWLEHSRFWIKNDGALSEKHSNCESSPTWPDNPELRR